MFVYIFEILKREMMSKYLARELRVGVGPEVAAGDGRALGDGGLPVHDRYLFAFWKLIIVQKFTFLIISIITILQIWPGISNYALTVVPAKGVVHCLIVASILVAKLGKCCQINILKNSIHLKLIKSHVLNQILVVAFKTFVLYLRCGLLVKHGLGGVETGIKLHIDAVQRRVKHLRLPAIVFNYSSN